MGRKKKRGTRLAYVEQHGDAFRGWYVEQGRHRRGPVVATEEVAHRWAMRKRREIERRDKGVMKLVQREVQTSDRGRDAPRRRFDPSKPMARGTITSIPLHEGREDESGDDPRDEKEKREKEWVLERRRPSAAAGQHSPASPPGPASPLQGWSGGRIVLPRADSAAGAPTLVPPESGVPRFDAGPTDAAAALRAHLETLDSVVHDFVACLDQGVLRGPVVDGSTTDTARFLRLLECAPPANQVLGPPVLFGASPPVGIESLLGFLSSLRKTGILRIQAGEVMYTISVVDGDVAHGMSDPRPESELLGNIIVARGTTDHAELARFFQACGSSRSKIGEALNRQALVSTDELRGALEQQMQQLFDRLLATRTSEWCFHEGAATLAYVDMRMNVMSVLLESARKYDEGIVA